MMQKRTLTSLLLISFLVAFTFSYSLANEVTFQSLNVSRCNDYVLDVTVENTVDVAAVEIVMVISSTGGGAYLDAINVDWDPAFTQLGTRIIDASQADGVAPDTIRLAAMLIDAADVVLPTGTYVVANVSFTTRDLCSGTVGFNGGIFDYPLPVTIQTQFVDANTFDILPVAVNAGTVTYVNTAPTLAAIPDATVAWGDLFSYNSVGDDADLANGCEALTYSKVSGPAALTVNPLTGRITWTPSGDDVCEHEVEIQVEDACGATATRTFMICVTNEPPVAESVTQDQPTWVTGDVVTATATFTDPDEGPGTGNWDVISVTPNPGIMPTIDNAGNFEWATVAFDESYTGTFEICLQISDEANICDPCSPANADTICFTVTILKALVVIDKLHGADGNGVFQGQEVTVPVYFDANAAIGGYNLLLSYDASALTFLGAEEGGILAGCEWEYFTYRTGPFGNCGSACPSGMVRLVAIAEYNDGPSHPNCFGTVGGTLPNGTPFPASADSTLAFLNFLVTDDRTLECQFVPISFYWYECGDNSMSDVSGQYLFVERSVWRYVGGDEIPGAVFGNIPDSYTEITDVATFPGGAGVIPSCLVNEPGKPVPMPCLDFWNGGVDIICAADIDDRGDINQDGVANTIADAVMFTNYFIFGNAAFEDILVDYPIEAATAASDVNADGLTLTVADLVYLIRIIVGDAVPYANSPIAKVSPIDANLATMNGNLSVGSDLHISAAYIELAGNVHPQLLAPNMQMAYHNDGAVTRVLVFAPFDGASAMESCSGAFLNIGNAQILTADLATVEGTPVHANVLPSEFALLQNYPNPFNPSTTIEFALPMASDYTLKVFNVTGQEVASFSGHADAGVQSIVWDAATKNASGVYFYRLSTDQFSQTKKMVLLK
jgi:hypothetical protein